MTCSGQSGHRQARVLVIGLDGATFAVLHPLMARGLLPVLKAFAASAARGILSSVDPCVTGPAWTSLATGKRPDNHGILDWSAPVPGSYRRQVVSARMRTDLAFWEILHREGIPSGTINLPLTYPPSPETSFCVSGMLTPQDATVRSHPPDLYPRLKRLGYRLDVVPRHYRRKGFHAFFDDLVAMTRARGRAVRHCLSRHPWQAAIAVFVGPDRIQHPFWQYLEPLRPDSDQAQGAIAYFQVLDQEIGHILNLVPPETHVYIVSDHGFGPHHRAFHVNDWLQAHGYLHRKKDPLASVHARRMLRTLLRRLDQSNQHKLRPHTGPPAARTPHTVLEWLHEQGGTTFGPLEPRVDWSRTVAFAPTPFGIRINLEGREPRGIVPRARYDQVRAEIRDRLAAVTDPRTGDRIHAAVLFREERFSGKHADQAPDLVYRFVNPGTTWRIGSLHASQDGRRLKDSCVVADMEWETGAHRLEGILLARGPDIRPGPVAMPMFLWDLLPTWLYHLDVPIPPDLDGRILTPIIHPRVLEKRHARTGATPAVREGSPPGPSPAAGTPLTSSDRSVEARLQDLGYLD